MGSPVLLSRRAAVWMHKATRKLLLCHKSTAIAVLLKIIGPRIILHLQR